MEAEFKEAVGKHDFEKIGKLKEEGYKPSEEFIKGIGKEHGLDERQTHEVIQLFGTKPEEQGEHERQAARLLDAAQTDNFHVIQEIQKEGYRLTQQDLTRMRERCASQHADSRTKDFRDGRQHKDTGRCQTGQHTQTRQQQGNGPSDSQHHQPGFQ